MKIWSLAALVLTAAAFAGAAEAAPATAATKPAAPKAASDSDSGSLLPGGNSKDPVSIEADQLVYSDKEGKAIYTGNVVLIQGPTKLTCSVMVLFVDKSNSNQGGTPTPTPSPTPSAAAAGGSSSSSSVRHMDCSGPVTVISKTQTATGDSAVFDKPQNKVWLFGNVTLSDGANVTKGDKLTYDTQTGVAHVETKPTQGKAGRVWSQFVPGSDDKSGAEANAATPSPSPTPAKSASAKPSAKPNPSKSSPAQP